MEIPYSGNYTKIDIKDSLALMTRQPLWVVVVRSVFGAMVLIEFCQKLYGMVFLQNNATWLEWIGVLILARIFISVFINPFIEKRRAISRLLGKPEEIQSGYIGWHGIKLFTPELRQPVGEIGWDAFIGVRVNRELLVLWTADQRVTILPKRFFETEKDWDTVLNTVAMRVVEAQAV